MRHTRKDIFKYMDSQVNDFIDSMTGELMVTELAEQAIQHFNASASEEDMFYDIAVDVEVKLLGDSYDNL